MAFVRLGRSSLGFLRICRTFVVPDLERLPGLHGFRFRRACAWIGHAKNVPSDKIAQPCCSLSAKLGSVSGRTNKPQFAVTKRDEVYAAIDHVEKELGGFDIMGNNAGVASVQPISEITPEEMEKTFQVNVHGVFVGRELRQVCRRHCAGPRANPRRRCGFRFQSGRPRF